MGNDNQGRGLEDLAMLIAAHAARDGDPLTRFVRSLPLEMRHYAEGTIRLREEFLINVQRMLSEEPNRALMHAEWIRENAQECAYRWSGLMKSVARWAALDVSAVHYVRRG